MNKGIKEYTKFIDQEIGRAAKVSLNLNKNDANMHISIALASTTGQRSMSIGLIFTLSDRNEISEFGRGIKLSNYKKIEFSTGKTEITITNNDGSKDIYIMKSTDKYFNEETQAEITVSYQQNTSNITSIILKDKYANEMEYKAPFSYPASIKLISNESYTIHASSAIESMINNVGDEIIFTKDGNLVKTISVLKNTQQVYMLNLEYDSDCYLKKITHTKEGKTLWINEYKFDIANQNIIIKDGLSNYRIKYTLDSSNRVERFKNGFDDNLSQGMEMTIVYDEQVTTLINYKQEKQRFFFDQNDLPIYEIDDKARAVTYSFDENKRLIEQSSLLDNSITNANSKSMIKNGYFSSDLAYWELSEGGTAVVTQEYTNELLEGVGDKTLRLNAYNNVTMSAKQSFSFTGLASDFLTLVFFTKQLHASSYIGQSVAKAVVYLKGEDTKDSTYIFPIKISNQPIWEIKSFNIIPGKSYNSVTVELSVSNGSIYIFDAVQMYVKPLGVFYKYDKKGNQVSSLNGKAKNDSSYDSRNMLSSNFAMDSTLSHIKRDDRGNVLEEKSAFDVKVTKTYNSVNNPLKARITSDGKTFEIANEYSADGYYLRTATDTAMNKTKYDYDPIYGRLNHVVDPCGTKTTYTYDAYDNIRKIFLENGEDSLETQCTYNLKNQLESMSSNDIAYKFEYNDKGQIKYVYTGNTVDAATNLVVNYDFEIDNNQIYTGKPKILKHGQSGDSLEFIYNEQDQLKELKLIKSSGVSLILFSYEYDTTGNLVKYTDLRSESAQEVNYAYNEENQLIKLENGSTQILEFKYDNLNKLNFEKRKVNGKTKILTYDHQDRSKGLNPQAVFEGLKENNYVTAFFNEDINGEKSLNASNNKKYITPYLGTGLEIKKDGFIPYVDAKSNATNRLSYAINPYCYYPLPALTVAFWFRISTTSFTGKYLFSAGQNTKNNFIGVYFNSSKQLCLKLIDFKGVIYDNVLTTSKGFISNTWNFFSLTVFNRDDGAYYSNVCTYEMTLNAEYKRYHKQDPRIAVELDLTCLMNIGCAFSNNNQVDKALADFTAIMLYPGHNMFSYEVNNYYRVTKDYILESASINSDFKVVNTTSTNLYTDNSNILNDFEIIPLNNSLLSLNGKKPQFMTQRETTPYDRDATFNYNLITKRYAYVADGAELVYDFNLSNSGTIAMKVLSDGLNSERQYLFQNYNSSNQTLGLYRDADAYLWVERNNTLYKTSLLLSANVWHFVAFTWSVSLQADSANKRSLYIRIVIDSQEYETTLVVSNFSNFLTSIGRRKEVRTISGIQEGYTDCFYGNIEMLSSRNIYASNDTLQNLRQNLNIITISKQYDQFGLLRLQTVKDDNITKIDKTYYYRTMVGNLTTDINQEVIRLNNTLITKQYSYDGNGNIIRILDPIETEYRYDSFNRLMYEYDKTRDNKITYKYDDNGNLTQKFYYTSNSQPTKKLVKRIIFKFEDSIFKDRLTAIKTYIQDNDTLISEEQENIKYEGTYLGNPSKIGNATLTWESKKLVKYIDSSKNLNISYIYDSQSNRIMKLVNGVKTNYYYSKGQLISEICGSKHKEFLYDEDNQLFGFVYNNGNTSSKYYYVKDVLSNIIGLVDTNGNLVVQYTYDAWGELKSTTGTLASTIGLENPFIYKCYYFDFETKLFLCKFRYYNPQAGRFISLDGVEYLAPENINGLNLYVYCSNNPVMYSDGSGCFPKFNDFSFKKYLKLQETAKNIWIDILDLGASLGSIVAGIVVGSVAGPIAGVATTGLINNAVNYTYYTFISDGQSSLNETSYNNKYINRWDRLDYTKQQTGESWYNLNAWRYYSEYSIHMYGWYATKWAYGKGIWKISEAAKSFKKADINKDTWDDEEWRNPFIAIWGLFGF